MILSSIMVGSCLISMMVIFISGIAPGIIGLLNMQLLTSILAMPIMLVYLMLTARRFGLKNCWRKIWDNLPGWLVFSFASINSLVVSGEISLIFAKSIVFETVEAGSHIPLICALTNSLTVCVLYAWRELNSVDSLNS
ncbi:MAG: hypothetical protein OEU86_02545 [Gammaproteobacteria bacterium]|nr:hypothetical protein [Gammaproteobacteria bacterium]